MRVLSWLLSLSFLIALAGCGSGGGTPPPRHRVEPPRDLNTPTRGVIHPQLLALADQPSRCFALLERASGLSVTREPDVQEGPLCGKINTVTIRQSPVTFAARTQVTCPMAAGLLLWQRDALIPLARKHLGVTVAKIETFGTYACRTRNNQPGARISEHARANAIDISGFVLADGRRISIKDAWNGSDAAARAFVRDTFWSGCRYFSVVLGPNSDAFHQDHLHFDLSRWGTCG
jgi:hypothetical protein